MRTKKGEKKKGRTVTMNVKPPELRPLLAKLCRSKWQKRESADDDDGDARNSA